MKISVLTMMPELFGDFLRGPVAARAVRSGALSVEIVDIRDYAPGSFRHIDDSPFGGGAGMVMRCQPLLDALRDCRARGEGADTLAFLLTPAGTPYSQKKAHELAKLDHLILICGHYEGVDARVEAHVDGLLSIGDYVLTGGEPAARIVMDTVIRLLPGSLRPQSTLEESFENGLLEYPQYTQPAVYEGMEVPEILRSGNHELIRRWRLQQSLLLTRERRPDLFARYTLTEEEVQLLEEVDRRKETDRREEARLVEETDHRKETDRREEAQLLEEAGRRKETDRREEAQLLEEADRRKETDLRKETDKAEAGRVSPD